MTRDSIQSDFHKISKPLIDKPSSFANKEMSFFCFSDDHYWRQFAVLPFTPSGVMIYFENQVFHLTRR